MHPDYADSLALDVVQNPDRWLGAPSGELVRDVLSGAEVRALLVDSPVNQHRIWGPTREPEFDVPFLKATGNPSLSIRCFSAVDLVWFDKRRGLLELASAMLEWEAPPCPNTPMAPLKAEDFFPAVFERPAMFIGRASGESLYAFLTGMTAGGDSIGLPKSPDASELFAELGRWSANIYGAPHAAFRVYNNEPEHLFDKARELWETLKAAR